MFNRKSLKSRIGSLEHEMRIKEIEKEIFEEEIGYLRRINNALLEELGYEPVVVEKHTKLEKKDGRD